MYLKIIGGLFYCLHDPRRHFEIFFHGVIILFFSRRKLYNVLSTIEMIHVAKLTTSTRQEKKKKQGCKSLRKDHRFYFLDFFLDQLSLFFYLIHCPVGNWKLTRPVLISLISLSKWKILESTVSKSLEKLQT